MHNLVFADEAQRGQTEAGDREPGWGEEESKEAGGPQEAAVSHPGPGNPTAVGVGMEAGALNLNTSFSATPALVTYFQTLYSIFQ